MEEVVFAFAYMSIFYKISVTLYKIQATESDENKQKLVDHL